MLNEASLCDSEVVTCSGVVYKCMREVHSDQAHHFGRPTVPDAKTTTKTTKVLPISWTIGHKKHTLMASVEITKSKSEDSHPDKMILQIEAHGQEAMLLGEYLEVPAPIGLNFYPID